MNVVQDAPTQAERAVQLAVRTAVLDAFLSVPPGAQGIVLFAHGSGSSRHSPRNRYVARKLQERGFATLLLDLLTPAEEATDARTAHLRFNIDLLAERLMGATDWVRRNDATGHLGIGYFGASTGAGAALIAAAERPKVIRAVVSRGGRPDLAGSALPDVQAPTLLIIGGKDTAVIQVNQEALAQLRVEKALRIVPGATHLFEEPGTIEAVSRLAGRWFKYFLPMRAQPDQHVSGR